MNYPVIGVDLAGAEDYACYLVARNSGEDIEILAEFPTEQQALRFCAKDKKHLRIVSIPSRTA